MKMTELQNREHPIESDSIAKTIVANAQNRAQTIHHCYYCKQRIGTNRHCVHCKAFRIRLELFVRSANR
jgi:hypothetical protein